MAALNTTRALIGTLPAPQEHAIEDNRDILHKCIEPEIAVCHLRAHGTFTADDVELIKLERLKREKVDKLLDKLLLRPEGWTVLIKYLEESRMSYVARRLENTAATYATVIKGASATTNPHQHMSDAALRAHLNNGPVRCKLLDRLDVESIVIYLTKIDESFQQSLRNTFYPMSTRDKVAKLLEHIQRKGEAAMKEFYTTLSNNQTDLYAEIMAYQ